MMPTCSWLSRLCAEKSWSSSVLLTSSGFSVVHIKRMESRLFGFPLSQLKRVAYDYAETNGIQHNFNRRTGEAGKDWCRDFMARHSDEISLRTHEPTSAAHARGFNQEPSTRSSIYWKRCKTRRGLPQIVSTT